jgi:hypothetical protein
MTGARKKVIWSITSGVLSVILACGFTVAYVTYQNQKWCDTLAALTENDPRKLPEPSTPAGKADRPQQIKQYDQLVEVRRGFRCGGAHENN